MKMTLKEVKERFEALKTLAEMVLPGKLKYAVAYNLEKLQRETERMEGQRLELCRRYAEKDKDGKPVMLQSVVDNQKTEHFKMSAENQDEFNREYQELLDMEVDIDIRTVRPEVIDRCEESDRYNIPTVAQILWMSFMIEDGK